ncbi:2OG-Fe(II) oxygenase family protein [Aliiglaciecola sp. M165]|uniref:2OG-Fe(II) oxygenase family protein n=1 Tax=Aliiglaciecola sp. M165 TaxID=2593649 RepID=UPI00117FF070|nr:2OG-Fe(II) oxygenase family protein [Aliiglaciecola sp. M165]TRY30622.1 proline hydroxylase [Aliiglaciecola sp. M165]
MTIEFNSSVDIDAATAEYAVDKRARIFNVLDLETAGDLTMYIHGNVPFEAAYVLNGEFKSSGLDELRAMPKAQLDGIMQQIHADAGKGVGFYYGRHKVDPKPIADNKVQEAFEFLNAPATLDAIKKISGFDDIVAASAQVTRYHPGNFLTRHNDINANEERRVAYVLNLTPDWHPDWGGLLQFYQADGTPRDAWAPMFNSLALFDVNHVHAVTYVAPYATKPRFSITGWFRAKPL